jgi:hypothetical protein
LTLKTFFHSLEDELGLEDWQHSLFAPRRL